MGRDKILTSDPLTLANQVDKLFSAYVDRYRYSALGFLVRGVSHNLNGALQILSMQMELLQGLVLKEGEKLPPPVTTRVEKCVEQIGKMKGLVETLIQKSSHDELDIPQGISLNDLLEEDLSLRYHDLFFKHEIEVKKILDSKLPPLKGYYVEFSEALAHLIQNGIEAMEKTPRKELTVMTRTDNQSIQVIIRDTGEGISEEVKQHLFQPFFTTKGQKHYGLGLFLARKLLTPYGASFDYISRDGGMIFSVSFPLQTAGSISFKE